jgi:hypothetical protein
MVTDPGGTGQGMSARKQKNITWRRVEKKETDEKLESSQQSSQKTTKNSHAKKPLSG